jgi:diaminopimelate dehydrogenase
MSARTKLLLVGFGNVGRSVMDLLPQYPDMEVIGVVTRRPESVSRELMGVGIYDLNQPEKYLHCGADVAVMCGGSKNDLPNQTPFFARYFNVVDSFDTHGHIGPYVDKENGQPMLGHLETVDIICRQSKHTGHIGIGWDPGTFSLMRALFGAGMAGYKVNAFYGLTPKGGLSMGHTNAIKGIPGVIDARQYTHAKPEAIERIRNGENPELTDRDKHWRDCLVVANDADHGRIMQAIMGMPIYFAPYDTKVTFVSQALLDLEKSDLAHDGLVIISGPVGYMEFKNVWKSNPTGTAGFLLAYARATHRANLAGRYGCLTALDTPVVDLLEDSSKRVSLI